jgi:hypothetical protein
MTAPIVGYYLTHSGRPRSWVDRDGARLPLNPIALWEFLPRRRASKLVLASYKAQGWTITPLIKAPK